MPPQAGIVPIAGAGQPAAPDLSGDPEAMRQAAGAAEDAALKQEAAAAGQQAKEITGAATQAETDITGYTTEARAAIDKAVAQLDVHQADRQAFADQQARLDEVKAARLQSDEAKLDQWVLQTPTRQATYAAAMHLAGPISILTALGGAITRQSGLAMLGALNGVVEGINSGAENQYNDAMKKWETAFDQMKHHQETTKEVYSTMMDAYKIRTDAADKAIEHTNTIMGDNVQKAQMGIGSAKDIFNAKEKAYDAVMKAGLALAKIKEARAARMQTDAALTQDYIDLAAERIYDGEDPTKVFTGARGQKGMGFQAAVYSRTKQLFIQRHGNDPQFIGHPELLNQAAGQFMDDARLRHLGTQREIIQAAAAAGKIEVTDQMLNYSIPLAMQDLDAYAQKFGRSTNLIPLNQIEQSIELQTQHPELAKLMVSVREVLANYNQLNARFGSSALPDREKNEQLLLTTMDPVTFRSTLERMKQESINLKYGARMATQPETYRLGAPPPAGIPPPLPMGSSGAGAASSEGWGRATVVP